MPHTAVNRTLEASSGRVFTRAPQSEEATAPASAPAILGLQRAVGNRRLAGVLQARRAAGHAGDACEQEADRIAEEVGFGATGLGNRDFAAGGLPVSRLQPSARSDAPTGGGSEVPPIVHDVLSTPGQALEPSVRGVMESRLGFDLGTVRVHTGGQAAASARAVDSIAYTVGSDVVFADGQFAPGTASGDRLLAHELVHVAQQHHQAVRHGQSGTPQLQRKQSPSSSKAKSDITPPTAGINKPGFIDHSDGANVRTGPKESGGETVRGSPLPPATQVFVSGQHPKAPEWWYVTAMADGEVIRGYVQGFRVTTDLPEPTARLYQIKAGDTVERLAVKEFSDAVQEDQDLRFYENVLLHVNQKQGRTGIKGAFQNTSLISGANNVQLVAGKRIWLVSPSYARSLKGVVPSGSLTGGATSKDRFLGHVKDILQSISESPKHLAEVAGEYLEAINEHLLQIFGIVGLFVVAEAVSSFLAAAPTGVSQIVALLIQLILLYFGLKYLVEATVEAAKHAANWLEIAWTARGRKVRIIEASKEFLKFLVSIAIAALSVLGVKGSIGKASKLTKSLSTPQPVLAVAGGGSIAVPGEVAGVKLGPPKPPGPLGAAGAMMVSEEGKSPHRAADSPTENVPASGSAKDEAAAASKEPKPASKQETPDAPATSESALKPEDPGKLALTSPESTHVLKGGIEHSPQSPYFGKWNAKGAHDWSELEKICRRDGFAIKSVKEDPISGVRRVEVERTGIDPKTKANVTGVKPKTTYPKDFSNLQIVKAGKDAFESAKLGEPNTKFEKFGTKTKKDGSFADAYFEGVAKAGNPPRRIRIQGWYRKLLDGTETITSHTPAFDESWPVLPPEKY